MTPKARRSLERYIADIGREYGLSGWQMALHEGTDTDGAAAEVACVYGRKIAHVGIHDDFGSFPPEEQRAVILHELTHIHLDQVTTLVADVLPGLIGAPAYAAFEAGYRQAMEHATDAIAAAIADKFPLWEG